MSAFSGGIRRMQEQAAALAVVSGNPMGDTWYVNSTSGVAGNSGSSPRHPISTLTRAVALASDGDTIICEPGGSETLTATISVTQNHLRIVCPVVNPHEGFELTGAGTLDLLTISGADVRVEGLKFTRTAGAGSTTAGILTTAAADRLAVINCLFDCSDLTSSWTNYGVEVTDAVQRLLVKGCKFIDCHRGVMYSTGAGITQVGSWIQDCEFWVAQATAWGIYAKPTSTGYNRGLVIKDCIFFNVKGSGAAAGSEAWDGTNGTDGTIGPIYIGADVDQWVIINSRCDTSTYSFQNLCRVDSGGTGTFTDNESGLDEDAAISTVDSKVVSTATLVSTASSKVSSNGTLVSTGNSQATSNGTLISTGNSQATSNGTLVSTADSKVVSTATLVSTGNSTGVLAESKATSNGLLVSTGNSQATSNGLLVSTGNSQATSNGLLVSTADSKVVSTATLVSTGNSTGVLAESKVDSAALLVSTGNSQATSNGTLVSTGNSQATSNGTLISTADSKVGSTATLVSTANSHGSLINAWDIRCAKKADLTLHNGTVEDIFTISGPIMLLGLLLHVTEAVSAHACAIGFELDPTIGGSNTPLDNKTADINAAALGDCFAVVGASGSALVKYANGTAIGLANDVPQILMAGGIDYVPANGNPTSGVGDVYLIYKPLTSTATVS